MVRAVLLSDGGGRVLSYFAAWGAFFGGPVTDRFFRVRQAFTGFPRIGALVFREIPEYP